MKKIHYEPTNEERMDIESPYFSQDWWRECEILPPDPWAYIVSDLQWSEEIIAYASTRADNIDTADVGHFPEDTSPTERLKEALSVVIQLREDIISMVSVKCTDLEFAWKWGEYQKAVATLHGVIPRLEGQKGIEKSSKKTSDIKFKARQWYALWFEEYKRNTKNFVSRTTFNSYFAKKLAEIKIGKRDIPNAHKNSVTALVAALLSDEKNESGKPKLTRHYTGNFWGDHYVLARDEAYKNKDNLPPCGEDNFPILK